MDENIIYHMGFSHFYGIGPLKYTALKERFGSAEEAYKAPVTLLEEIIGPLWTARFNQFRRSVDLKRKYEEIKKKGITILTVDDVAYPKKLKEISDPPICLYTKGNLRTIDFEKDMFFGVVGTRKPTSYGQQITYKFTTELSQAGFVIVSGLALGVDTIAHRSALQVGGKTVAVLGCGVDIIYPPSNYDLYKQIVDGGGIILSEFPPGLTVLKGLFVARNRIISGLSIGILVAEGAKESGALITARYAAEQGREVFAPPVPLTSQMSEAPNILLKQGAKFVTNIEDILEEFHMRKGMINRKTIQALPPNEAHIVEILSKESKSADELVLETQQTINALSYILSTLEIKNVIEKDEEGRYQMKLVS